MTANATAGMGLRSGQNGGSMAYASASAKPAQAVWKPGPARYPQPIEAMDHPPERRMVIDVAAVDVADGPGALATGLRGATGHGDAGR